MKKIIAFILLITAAFAGCGTNKSEASYNVTDETFTDTLHENSRITVIYPQFSDKDRKKTNSIIKDFAESMACEFYGEDYADLTMDSSYDITYCKNNLLSVVFEVTGYVSTAAAPNNFIRAINIDFETDSIISLSDIYSVDDDFAEVIDADFHEQFLPKKLKEWGINEDHELYDKYKKELSHVGPCNLQGTLLDKNRFYFSENALVICAGVEHAIGDHFEVEAEYSELRDFVNAETLYKNVKM